MTESKSPGCVCIVRQIYQLLGRGVPSVPTTLTSFGYNRRTATVSGYSSRGGEPDSGGESKISIRTSYRLHP